MCGTVEADEIAVITDPITWRVGRVLSEIALVLWLQMCGLETISTTQWNGQGPDSSLKWLWAFIWIDVYTVEQVVVYSTLPQEYSTLTFGGEVVAGGGGVEERSEVMYWHRGAYIIYYKEHNVSQLYSVTNGGLRPCL